MFDLHTHTTASDGILTPEALVKESVRLGLGILAISDHDTLAGIKPGIMAAVNYSLKLIPAVELSVEEKHGEIHILGYYIDIESRALQKKLARLRFAREKRLDLIIENLNKAGIAIERRHVEEQAKGDSIGRPHVAQALVCLGCCRNTGEAFERYLKKGAPGFVERERLLPGEAMELILNAGGVPVLAHPVYVSNLDKTLPSLAGMGLMGIEAYYPSHSPLQTQRYLEMAARFDLAVTAGTDFHGPGIGPVESPGFSGIPHQVAVDFINFCQKRGIDTSSSKAKEQI